MINALFSLPAFIQINFNSDATLFACNIICLELKLQQKIMVKERVRGEIKNTARENRRWFRSTSFIFH